MKFKQVVTPSLAQFSYVIAEEDQMVVIDPRTDVAVYLELATQFDARIVAIFETHRNEDFISGAPSLARLTGAEVYRSGYEDLPYAYGTPIDENFSLKLGEWKLVPIHTPGHTKGHLCYLLKKQDQPYILFSGDTLFYGDLGRSDFYGKSELEAMTGALYDSIFQKLLPLGDEVILMPAHGSGSACGSSIEERPISTLGYERFHSPVLKVKDKAEFLEKHARMHPKPPYMEYMEKVNLREERREQKSHFPMAVEEADWLIDVRSREAYLQAHFDKAVWMRPGIINAHLGWLAKHDQSITFCVEEATPQELSDILLTIQSMGYENFQLMRQNSIREAKVQAMELRALEEISPRDFLKIRKKVFLLDVRKPAQVKKHDRIKGDLFAPVEELSKHLSELDAKQTIYVVCNSGERATVAASRLQREGFDVVVIAGGMMAIEAASQ